jgi:uncharacterized protein YkwD
MSLNVIDILLVVVVLLAALYGWRRGFIYGVLDLAGWVLGLVAALRFYQPVARFIGRYTNFWSETWDQPVAFLLIALFVSIGVHFLSFAILRRIPQKTHERSLNKILGIVPGLANGFIAASILSALLLSVPISDSVSERTQDSAVANRLAVYAEQLEAKLNPVFGDAVARSLNLLTIKPESNERVNLPFTVAKTRPRPDLEARMLELVNKERVANGLRPLAADPELTEVARKHSADMFARGYFAHDTPEGLSPFDRMKVANVQFLTAGENLALAPSVQVAHTGLMNSPGHRANILRGQFGRLGIGIMDGGMRGIMVSQEFRN